MARKAAQDRIRRAVRERVLADMNKPVSKTHKPLLDFGFLSDEKQALEDFDLLRNYSIMEVAGGWKDQGEAYQHDISTLFAVYADERAKIESKDARSKQKKPPKFDELFEDGEE